jgi:hypothetical protein
MVECEREAERRRLRMDGNVKIVSTKSRARLSKCGLEQSQFANARGAAGLLDERAMEGDNLTERKVTHQAKRL